MPGPGGALPVRLYRPARARAPDDRLLPRRRLRDRDLDTHDGTCRALANATGCAVVSVGYRLAPEHRFPAAPEDCWAALVVAERGAELGLDPRRLAVAGDSAGGNLAAMTALLARERGPDLRYQLLVYPVTDHGFDTPSYRENGEGYFLSAAMMRWFWAQYLEDAARARTRSPRRSAADLTGLPPALVLTAEYDPLRDEGEAYAARLRGGGRADGAPPRRRARSTASSACSTCWTTAAPPSTGRQRRSAPRSACPAPPPEPGLYEAIHRRAPCAGCGRTRCPTTCSGACSRPRPAGRRAATGSRGASSSCATRDAPALQALYRPLWDAYAAGHRARLAGAPPEALERQERMLRAADHLAHHLHEAPVILVFCFDPRAMAITDAGSTGRRSSAAPRSTRRCRTRSSPAAPRASAAR